MIKLRFEWDEAKNISNRKKHGVSFEEAAQIFRDSLYVSVKERIEDGEQRWQSFGVVGDGMLLLTSIGKMMKMACRLR